MYLNARQVWLGLSQLISLLEACAMVMVNDGLATHSYANPRLKSTACVLGDKHILREAPCQCCIDGYTMPVQLLRSKVVGTNQAVRLTLESCHTVLRYQ